MDNRRAALYFLLGFFLGVLLFAAPAHAQTTEIDTKWVCGRTEAIKEDLTRSGERFWASGAIQGGTDPQFLMSIWVNPNTTSWSIVATLLRNNAVSCVVTFGTGWREQPRNTI